MHITDNSSDTQYCFPRVPCFGGWHERDERGEYCVRYVFNAGKPLLPCTPLKLHR